MLAKAYKEKGGSYKGGEGEKQKDLKRWGKEKWMTREEYEKMMNARKNITDSVETLGE